MFPERFHAVRYRNAGQLLVVVERCFCNAGHGVRNGHITDAGLSVNHNVIYNNKRIFLPLRSQPRSIIKHMFAEG